MTRYLILAGTKQEYWAYLREHKIGFLEAEYVSHPKMLNGQIAPITKTGTWKTQSPEILEAAKKYMNKHKKLNMGEKNSQENDFSHGKTAPRLNHEFRDAFGDDTCETCGKSEYWHVH